MRLSRGGNRWHVWTGDPHQDQPGLGPIPNGVAAIVARGSCKEKLSLPVTAGAAPLLRSRKLSAAKPPLQKRVSDPISGNDELFRKFVRWSSETQLSEARSTTVVVSADPGAVVTSARPALSEAEPAKPEPVASKPSVNGQWLIQIGASTAKQRQGST